MLAGQIGTVGRQMEQRASAAWDKRSATFEDFGSWMQMLGLVFENVYDENDTMYRSRPGLEGTKKDFVNSAMVRSLGVSSLETWTPTD